MDTDKPIYEIDKDADARDPDEISLKDRKVVTQPYDIAVQSLVSQVKNGTIFVKPLSERPKFQRNYVWKDDLASRLVESIILNVPIPPCYLSQNDEFELDVIDGQQRIYSLYRFAENQFPLKDLHVLSEQNGKRFHQLESRVQRQILTFSLRCIVIMNESHPEIKFDVFERLNSNTVPLNAQELRNCIYRGPLIDLIGNLSFDHRWLQIAGRKLPDKRLRDDELILRFFAFELLGLDSYKTPLKYWLNDASKIGRKLTVERIDELSVLWDTSMRNIRLWFEPLEAFRREGSKSLNRALFDIIMVTASKFEDHEKALLARDAVRATLDNLLADEVFQDLISRSVDHTSRAKKRFKMWQEKLDELMAG